MTRARFRGKKGSFEPSCEVNRKMLKLGVDPAILLNRSKSGFARSIGMKENIVQKLTSKDDKYACAFSDRIVAESYDTDEFQFSSMIGGSHEADIK